MKPDMKPFESKMQKTLEILDANLAGIRAGRANAAVQRICVVVGAYLFASFHDRRRCFGLGRCVSG